MEVRDYGRMGKWDMGFLDMQTAEHEETPGENFGVLRMRRQVINPEQLCRRYYDFKAWNEW